jgi:cytochrome P450
MPVFDPFDREFHANPYPVYRQLRDEFPVYRNDERGFFALTRYEDVLAATRDPGTFTSGAGIMLDNTGIDMIPMLLTMDPPHHDELRRLVNRAFTPRRIAVMEAEVRASVQACLDELPDASSFDAVAALTARVPMDAIAGLIGVPREDLPTFRGLVRQLFSVFGAVPSGAGLDPAVVQIVGELLLYMNELVERRRATPADDLASALIAAEEDGRQLTHDELIGFLLMLLAAGIETTTNLLSNSLVVLAEHPAVRERVARDRGLLPAAVEEVLRYDSPVPGFFRTLSRDVVLHDVEMPAGAKVLLAYGSANRDDRVFVHPDRFDIDRTGAPSIAFGHGAHFCLGAALARLEARVTLHELLDRAPVWEVDVAGAERIHSAYARGYVSLPLTLRATASL